MTVRVGGGRSLVTVERDLPSLENCFISLHRLSKMESAVMKAAEPVARPRTIEAVGVPPCWRAEEAGRGQ